ncbi:MAG: tRNA (adenosine(37)-N6)-threonylcarbamoyltransferase complex ATPase subunit type 1 TsaE [Candidatus Paceibacterota bacterium]|jgi:tRNA threonylcarbamoyladenosine biosynthesis protein TsaE
MIYTSNSLEETEKLAEIFVEFIKQNPAFNIYGFSGDLGSGKTAFTKSMAKILGISDYVTSPTFVIQKKYLIPAADFPFKNLVHIDSYRLESGRELENLHFKETLEDSDNLILIEWPEKVDDVVKTMLPTSSQDFPILTFTFIDDYTRTIEFPAIMEA